MKETISSLEKDNQNVYYELKKEKFHSEKLEMQVKKLEEGENSYKEDLF